MPLKGRLMTEQHTTNHQALKLFFTDDIYLIPGEENNFPVTAQQKAVDIQQQAAAPVLSSSPEVQQEAPQKKERSFSYLGKNSRNILILVKDEKYPVSTEEGRELLRKIVKAIDLSANDFALVNCAAYADTDFNELKAFFAPVLLLSFGPGPVSIGLKEQEQNSLCMQEGIQLVFSSDLHDLSSDMNGKKALWNTLKKLSL